MAAARVRPHPSMLRRWGSLTACWVGFTSPACSGITSLTGHSPGFPCGSSPHRSWSSPRSFFSRWAGSARPSHRTWNPFSGHASLPAPLVPFVPDDVCVRTGSDRKISAARFAPVLFRCVSEGDEHWREAMASHRGVILGDSAHRTVGVRLAVLRFGSAAAHSRGARKGNRSARSEIHGRDSRARRRRLRDPFRGGRSQAVIRARSSTEAGGDRRTAGRSTPPRGRSCERNGKSAGRCLSPVGPAALARATGVRIVPVFNFREARFITRTVIRPAIR